ncbi:MAG TPA: GNAT family N-acetyltransferase [Acidimicrobiales bacterium]|nr:GNAT family N-acetyltransferase [Acidimicrobiales bacterium]
MELVEICYRSESSARTWTSEFSLVQGPRTSRVEIERSVTGIDSMILVGEFGGVLASCCRLTRAPRQRAHLGLFCVRPHLQSQGLGSELLEEALSVARQRFDANVISLQVLAPRTELRAWYERIGFHETGERLSFSNAVGPTFALVGDLEFVIYERALNGSSNAL